MGFGLVNLHMKSMLPDEFVTISGDELIPGGLANELIPRDQDPSCQHIKNTEHKKT